MLLFSCILAEAIMPENNSSTPFYQVEENVSVVILLPLFFCFLRVLRTPIGLIDDPHLWRKITSFDYFGCCSR
jgi:hypothetical protein